MDNLWTKPLQKMQQPEQVSSNKCCKGTSAQVMYSVTADNAYVLKLHIIILIKWEKSGGEGGENS